MATSWHKEQPENVQLKRRRTSLVRWQQVKGAVNVMNVHRGVQLDHMSALSGLGASMFNSGSPLCLTMNGSQSGSRHAHLRRTSSAAYLSRLSTTDIKEQTGQECHRVSSAPQHENSLDQSFSYCYTDPRLSLKRKQLKTQDGKLIHSGEESLCVTMNDTSKGNSVSSRSPTIPTLLSPLAVNQLDSSKSLQTLKHQHNPQQRRASRVRWQQMKGMAKMMNIQRQVELKHMAALSGLSDSIFQNTTNGASSDFCYSDSVLPRKKFFEAKSNQNPNNICRSGQRYAHDSSLCHKTPQSEDISFTPPAKILCHQGKSEASEINDSGACRISVQNGIIAEVKDSVGDSEFKANPYQHVLAHCIGSRHPVARKIPTMKKRSGTHDPDCRLSERHKMQTRTSEKIQDVSPFGVPHVTISFTSPVIAKPEL